MATRKGCSPSPDDYGTEYASMLKGSTNFGLPFYVQSRIWYLAAFNDLLLRHELRNHLIDHLSVRLALKLHHNSFHNLPLVP